MAKQDWSTRMVWVVGFDTDEGFNVEVYQEERNARKAGAEFVLEVLKAHHREELAEAKAMFDKGNYEEVLELHDDLVNEFSYADEYVMIWYERIR